jgi:hypothetical protein
MDMGLDAAIDRREKIGTLERLARFVLVAYLSPVILIVLAIGLVGMLAAKIGKPTARVASNDIAVTVEGVHSGHEPTRPLGLAKSPVQARELV